MGDTWSISTDIKSIDHHEFLYNNRCTSHLRRVFSSRFCSMHCFAWNTLKWIFKCLKKFILWKSTNKMPSQHFFLIDVRMFYLYSFCFHLDINTFVIAFEYEIITPRQSHIFCSNGNAKNEYCTYLKRMRIFEDGWTNSIQPITNWLRTPKQSFSTLESLMIRLLLCCTSAYSYAQKCFIERKNRNQLRNQHTFFRPHKLFRNHIFHSSFKYLLAKFNVYIEARIKFHNIWNERMCARI